MEQEIQPITWNFWFETVYSATVESFYNVFSYLIPKERVPHYSDYIPYVPDETMDLHPDDRQKELITLIQFYEKRIQDDTVMVKLLKRELELTDYVIIQPKDELETVNADNN